MKVRIFSTKSDVERVAMRMMHGGDDEDGIFDLYCGPEKSAQETFDIFLRVVKTCPDAVELRFFCNNGTVVSAILGYTHAKGMAATITIAKDGVVREYHRDHEGYMGDGWPYGYYEVDWNSF